MKKGAALCGALIFGLAPRDLILRSPARGVSKDEVALLPAQQSSVFSRSHWLEWLI